MSRIQVPATIDAAPEASRPLLEQVNKQLGSTPNLFRLVAQSPAALEGYLGLSGALGSQVLLERLNALMQAAENSREDARQLVAERV